ncbi:MAG: NUDIX domain-containing protein [Xanthobacteraceae bacterium]|nr:NUDIX domain-containing protein [Xanthobacteraceae bacterium]MCW5675211.1 NUDIX domain-containing protein [Xanthobacteraceae bacterium]
MIRRFLHLYWRMKRGMTLGVRGAVLRDGEVMLVRHGYVPGWHLPGGGVEPGESFEEALAKELMEEANVRVTGTPKLHALFQNMNASARDHVAVYVVREFDYGGPLPPSFEIKEAKFFPLDALPEETTQATRRRLAEITGGAPPSQQW